MPTGTAHGLRLRIADRIEGRCPKWRTPQRQQRPQRRHALRGSLCQREISHGCKLCARVLVDDIESPLGGVAVVLVLGREHFHEVPLVLARLLARACFRIADPRGTARRSAGCPAPAPWGLGGGEHRQDHRLRRGDEPCEAQVPRLSDPPCGAEACQPRMHLPAG
uniref:Uncharacterized protein n=1 Tax=Tetraselmis sp. GSL018 TaxID=582737 RepID=A0A061RKS7_9CHLO